jgi:hypothetical protein
LYVNIGGWKAMLIGATPQHPQSKENPMFTHDPYQAYSTLGAYATGGNPFGLPYSQGFNPGLGVTHPQQLQQQQLQQQLLQQQLQIAQALATQAAIQQQLQNPLLTANIMQNPYAAAVLQNPLLNPILAQVGMQSHPLHPQIGQFGGLQPQSWVGQGGLGVGQQFGPQQFGPQQIGPQQFGPQQFGTLHPLIAAQLGARTGQNPGINPWGVPGGQGY